jgi:choice-of-anchor C domain-containing protein
MAKKIIKSLAVVIAVASFAGYPTFSFFSDTETSTGNTFTAGSIDLQVDSTAHYDGMICEAGHWKDEASCTETGSDLSDNGGFENGTDPGSYKTLNPGETDISDWTIDSGSADYIGNYWSASGGGRSIDLNGLTKGSLSQTLTTVDGATYKVSFDLSGNPDSRSDTNDPLYSPSNKEVAVSATGEAPMNFNFDTNVEQNTLADMKWKSFSYTFVATGTSTVLTFASQIPGAFGPALDNVDVHEEICEPPSTSDLLGEECDGTWNMTDLGAEKFFNFTDIKPGDFGEDTVSLHVSDNDAWLRLVIDHIVDNEGDPACSEPEKVDDPGCETDAEGDLRSKLLFNVWLDNGAGSGGQACDNIRNGDELPIISDGPINADGETWNLKDFNNLFLPKNQTTCFGIGWTLPSSVENEIQTDVFGADISFEVQQVRNNPNPFHEVEE